MALPFSPIQYNDIFLAKYDANGNVLWAKRAGGTGGTNDDDGISASADAAGNVFITGMFGSSTLTFGSTTLTNIGGDYDIFLAKYDANGNVLWAKSAGGGSFLYIYNAGTSVSTDAGGNVFVTGYFQNPALNFGSTILTNASVPGQGVDDIFIAKYDANGNFLWAKRAGGTDDDEGVSASTDAGGNVFVTGTFNNASITFGSVTLTNTMTNGTSDMYIVKYDGSGNSLWAHSAGGTNWDGGSGASTDASGNVFVTGWSQSSNITFGSTTLTPPPATCTVSACYPMFIVKYNANGNVLCTSILAGGSAQQGPHVSADPFGNACIGGDFIANPFSVGSNTLTLTSDQDVFVAKWTCGCSVIASANGNTTICAGQTATLTASGGNNYSWNTGSTTSSIIVAPTSTSSYTVVVSSSVSCSDVASVTVTVAPPPTASVNSNQTICSGQATTITASGGTNYSWSNGSSTATINISPTSTSTYSVIVSSGSCSDTASVTIVVSPPPIASANGATICSGQNAILTASGGGTYAWSNGNTNSTINVSPTLTSTYSVIVSIGSCSDIASATVTVNPSPTANAGSDITITQGQSTTLSASGGGTYLWSDGSTTSAVTVNPSIITTYTLIVTDVNGCTDIDIVTVFVELNCGTFFLPNAFSPNGDNENDELKIYIGNYDCIKQFHIVIFSRWGEKVFETENPSDTWDGSYKGKIESTAVFAYYMKATLISGEQINKKGNISLIK